MGESAQGLGFTLDALACTATHHEVSEAWQNYANLLYDNMQKTLRWIAWVPGDVYMHGTPNAGMPAMRHAPPNSPHA